MHCADILSFNACSLEAYDRNHNFGITKHVPAPRYDMAIPNWTCLQGCQLIHEGEAFRFMNWIDKVKPVNNEHL